MALHVAREARQPHVGMYTTGENPILRHLISLESIIIRRADITGIQAFE